MADAQAAEGFTQAGGNAGLRGLFPAANWTAISLVVLPALFILVAFIVPLGRIILLSLSDPEGPLATYRQLWEGAVYWRILGNTLQTAFYVTIITLVAAYPIAYAMNSLNGMARALVYWCVLLPFWISVLVRTFSWMLVLDRMGPVNKALMAVGITSEPVSMLFTSFAVYVGMVHVMIPFAVVPISTGMATIDKRLLLASEGLGASPLRSFWTIYFPLSLPGVCAAATLVFVLSLGFFITPAILGGGRSVMAAELIYLRLFQSPDWGLGATISVLMMVIVGLLLALLMKFVRPGGMVK